MIEDQILRVVLTPIRVSDHHLAVAKNPSPETRLPEREAASRVTRLWLTDWASAGRVVSAPLSAHCIGLVESAAPPATAAGIHGLIDPAPPARRPAAPARSPRSAVKLIDTLLSSIVCPAFLQTCVNPFSALVARALQRAAWRPLPRQMGRARTAQGVTICALVVLMAGQP